MPENIKTTGSRVFFRLLAHSERIFTIQTGNAEIQAEIQVCSLKLTVHALSLGKIPSPREVENKNCIDNQNVKFAHSGHSMFRCSVIPCRITKNFIPLES